MTNTVTFIHDNSITITLPEHPKSDEFCHRSNCEVLFRKLNTYLINNNVIPINKNIIDLGAFIGDNSIPWAKNINGIVYAIDPSPANIQFIKNTCVLNEIKNVICIETAISDKHETLSTNASNIDHCSFVYDNPLNNGYVKQQAVSLDYLHEVDMIKDIGYIHLDVEGMEYRVLIGCNAIIDMYKPIITFEQHLELDDYTTVLNFLKNKQYIVYLINEVLPGCRPDCRNSIAFHKDIYTEALVTMLNISEFNNILLKADLLFSAC